MKLEKIYSIEKTAGWKSGLLKTLLAGGALAGAGIYANQNVGGQYIHDPEDPEDTRQLNVPRWRDWLAKFFLSNAEKQLQTGQHDLEMSTGIHRESIPGWALTEDAILNQPGYFESLMAIPEQGQSSMTTFRQENEPNTHLHQHPKSWMMHLDSHPSSQALRRKGHSLYDSYIKGSTHTIEEGVPGFLNWTKNVLTGNDTLEERQEKKQNKDQEKHLH